MGFIKFVYSGKIGQQTWKVEKFNYSKAYDSARPLAMVWMDRNSATPGLNSQFTEFPKPGQHLWHCLLYYLETFILSHDRGAQCCPRFLVRFLRQHKVKEGRKDQGLTLDNGTVYQQTYQGAARGESWVKSFIGAGWGAWEWGNCCSHRGLLCVSPFWNCLPRGRQASLGDFFLYWCRRQSRVIDNFIGILFSNRSIYQPPINCVWQLLNRKCQLLFR